MIPYLLRRVLIAIPLVFAMTFVIYAIVTWQGYSAFDQLANDPTFSRRDLVRMKREAHIYDPLWVRYGHWVRGVLFDLKIGRPRYALADFESDTAIEEHRAAATDGKKDRLKLAPRRDRYLEDGKGGDAEAREGQWLETDLPGGAEAGAELKRFLSPYGRRSLPGSDWARESPDAQGRRFCSLELDLKNLGTQPLAAAVEVADGKGKKCREGVDLKPGELRAVGIPFAQLRGDGVDVRDIQSLRVTSAQAGRLAIDEVRLVEDRFPLSAGLPNFGTSFSKRQPVVGLILEKVRNTILLTLGAVALTWLIALPIGIYSAVKPHSIGDRLFSLLAFVGMATPSFFMALLVIFCMRAVFYDLPVGHPFYRILPTDGRTSPNHDELSLAGQCWDVFKHMILPMIVISMAGWAGTMRVMRATMLEIKNQPFITTARAKGVPERWILFKHCLKNALLPFVASLGSLLPALIGGSAFVEILFSFPGIGQEMLLAVQQYDINVVMAASFLSAMLLVAGNLLSDVLLAWVDPRISHA